MVSIITQSRPSDKHVFNLIIKQKGKKEVELLLCQNNFDCCNSKDVEV